MRTASALVFVHAGFGTGAVPYLDGWQVQRRLHERRAAGVIPDCCLLLEHEPVYTAGKRTEATDRPVGDPGAPVIEVDRGGRITWHGPGQLVGYPIVSLRDPVDVVDYVRALEEALIRTCAGFGVAAGRVKGRSGVWVTGTSARAADGVAASAAAEEDGSAGAAADPALAVAWPGVPDRKLAAIGVRVARGVTMHGFALNCACDLSWYDRIVPCGIRDATVTTLTAEAGRAITVTDVLPAVQQHLADALGATSWQQIDGADALLAAEPVG